MTTIILTNGFKFEGTDDQIEAVCTVLKYLEGKTIVRWENPHMEDRSGKVFIEVSPFGQEDIDAWGKRCSPENLIQAAQ